MSRFLMQFTRPHLRPEDNPLTLWNDIFLVAVGFFSLGVSLCGLLAESGPRFAAGAHVDKTPLVACALIGAIALFFIVEGYIRIDRTIHQVNQALRLGPPQSS
jgi:hypothetical protein